LFPFAAIGAVIQLVVSQGMAGPDRVLLTETLVGGLVALYALLLPLTLRAGRQFRDQGVQLEGRSKQLTALVDQLPAAVWATDDALRFTGAHGSALAQLGLDGDAMVGATLSDVFHAIDPEAGPVAAPG
jgi:PAS domain-containing protein